MSTSDSDRQPDNKQATRREKVYSWFIMGIVFLCLLLIVTHPFVSIKGTNLTTLDVDGNIGWKYDDGTDADLANLRFDNGRGVVTREITSVFSSGKDLCFESSNLFFRVYLNDQPIYDFHPEIKFYYGKYYGDYTHLINIPYFRDTGKLKIEYEALTYNSWTSFRAAQMSEGSEYLRNGISTGIFQFALCFSTIIIGIIIIIMGCIFHSKRNSMIETVSLGAVAILMACYLMAGTKIWQLIFLDSAMPRLIEYTTLALIPVPVALFVATFTNRLEKKLPLILCITSSLLITGIFFSIFTGLYDYSNLLPAIHVNIIGSMTMLIAYFFFFLRQETKVTGNKWLLIAFVVLITTGVIDIALYYIQQQDYQIRIVNFGLGFFIIVLALYEIGNIMEINQMNIEADTMYRLARIDGLTGLSNRLSFDEAEKDLAGDFEATASLALLDINFLKTVNDKFGHSEGDRHIKAAAKIIEESFGQQGRCFRIGGDEFFAIITGEDHEEKMKAAMKKLAELTEAYNKEQNPPIDLNIACGTATYEFGKNSVFEAEKIADSNMYLHKKRIKEKMGDL